MIYKDFVTDLAIKAGDIMLSNFTIGMKMEWKKDDTPVTVTDKIINRLVIQSIEKEFPEHGVLGEEESAQKESEYIWVCDPIDGTAAFSHGYPTFVFSLALTKNGESILGVLYDPVLKRLAYAEKRKGAFLNGKTIKVSDQKKLNAQSFVNIDVDKSLIRIHQPLIDKGCWVSVIYSALYPCLLVACGEFVGEIYEYSNPWDAAAAKVIVEEAGGRVTDLEGNDQRYDKEINGFIASNGLVHQELLDIIKNGI